MDANSTIDDSSAFKDAYDGRLKDRLVQFNAEACGRDFAWIIDIIAFD